MKKLNWLGTASVIVLFACTPQVTAQDAPNVLQAIQFETNGDVPGFLERMSRANEIATRLDIGKIRVFQATFAGPNTGRVFILYESDSMVSFAADDAAWLGDAEAAALMAELAAAGQTEISNSLSIEVTP